MAKRMEHVTENKFGITEDTAAEKLDGNLIKNIIIHRFLPDLASNFYKKHLLRIVL